MSPKAFETADGAGILFRRREGRGPVVVFSHPHSGRQDVFDPLLDVWSGNALTWDRRGYGASTQGADPTIAQEEDLLALLDHLGIARAVLVGVAAGGAASVGPAARRPERVAALALVSTFMGKPHRWWLEATGEPRPTGDAAGLELSPAFRSGPRAAAWIAMARENAAQRAGEPPQPAGADLEALRAVDRVHVATGELDRMFTPAMLRHASTLLPNATTTLLPGVAHAAPYEDPEGFAVWLDGVISRA